MAVNLKAFPEVHFTNASAGTIEAELVAAYETANGVKLQPGDLVRLCLESLAYVISVQNSLIDRAGRQKRLEAFGWMLPASVKLSGRLSWGQDM